MRERYNTRVPQRREEPVVNRRLLVLPVALAIVLASGCAAEPTPSTETPSKGRIVFDMGHGEIFGADDTSELGQSQAIAQMRAAGYEVVVNSDTITLDDLAGASGLVLAGPMSPLAEAEYVAIESFVEAGGTMLLTIHVPFPVMGVPSHWALPVGTQILMSQSPYDASQPSVFVADSVAPSPLTEGVSQIVVVSGWPVTAASPEAELLVSTRQDTWLSQAGDQQPIPPADAQFAPHGVVGVTSLGKGRVVVVGDDAVFANLALGEGDNARLLGNILGLMTAALEI
jgi:hypothetical protein